MAQADKERWDKKHAKDMMPKTPIPLLTNHIHLAHIGKALDIACGNGRHSKYLVSKGFEVDALDISSVAIEALKDEAHIEAKEVDFESYALKKESYDLIIVSYYLERKLFSQMIEALKPNGILIMETFVQDKQNERTPSNPSFRLKENELQDYFEKKLHIIHLEEWWDKDYQGFKTRKASMVAQKEANS